MQASVRIKTLSSDASPHVVLCHWPGVGHRDNLVESTSEQFRGEWYLMFVLWCYCMNADISTNSLVDLEISIETNSNDNAYSDTRATSGSGLHDYCSDMTDEPCRDGGRTVTGSPTINPATILMADTSLITPAFSASSGTDADSWVNRFAN